MPKFYEVPVIGDGTAENPYRPDVPEGVSWTASDGGSNNGGLGATGGKGTGAFHPETGAEGKTGTTGGKMLVMIPDVDDDPMGTTGADLEARKTKLAAAQQALTANPKVLNLVKRKDLSNKQRTDMAKPGAVPPSDSVPGKALEYGLTEAEIASWRA